MAAVVGFAFLVMVAMPVGKRFFPACHHLHPQRHALHGDNSSHGKKSGRWPFKKSAVGVKKQLLVVAHRESNEEEVLYIDM